MKNPKILATLALILLFAFAWSFRTGGSLSADLNSSPLRVEEDSGLNMKVNTFKALKRKNTKPPAPTWGSFKTEVKATKNSATAKVDKNKEYLKNLVDKVNKRIKEFKKKQARLKRLKAKETLAKKVDQSPKANQKSQKISAPEPTPAIAIITNKPTKEDAKKSELQEKRSFEEWRQLIVENGQDAAVDELISQYHQNQLGEAEWAFVIAQELLISEDVSSQQRALKILDGIPSQQSFTILAHSQGLSPNQELNSQIDQSLAQYSKQLNYLSILEASLNAPEPKVAETAARLMKDSANYHLARRGRTRTGRSNNLVHRFQSTVQILTRIGENTTDPELKVVFNETKEYIESYLTTSRVAVY